MLRRTLLDFYADLSTIPGEFVVYDDGYRSWSYTYAQIAAAAGVFASRLRAEGIAKGQAVAIWGENRAEWIIALWGCLLEGVVLVPIDSRASADFLLRVTAIVDARAVLASACLPMLFQAVEIDGQAYWDGGYSVNPALSPLIQECAAADLLLVQINPLTREHTPRSSAEILDRINELTFNASLLTQMRAIDFVNELLADGAVSHPFC